MRATINIDGKTVERFKGTCEVMVSKVGNGSRKAAQEACETILEESLRQVPVDTGTLASSASYKITGNYKTGWFGTVSYASDIDPINPKTGRPASEYMVAVHEDLEALHIIGKAKFLEDPAREYAKERYPRTVFKYVQESLADV